MKPYFFNIQVLLAMVFLLHFNSADAQEYMIKHAINISPLRFADRKHGKFDIKLKYNSDKIEYSKIASLTSNKINLNKLEIRLAEKKSYDDINIKLPDVTNKSKVNYYKVVGLSVVTIGAGAFLHNLQKNAWWSGTREKFHVQFDWAYAMSMDKLGHFFEGGLISNTMMNAFRWSGIDYKTSIWLGSLVSIAYMTDIEVEDGFAKAWGYSPGDEIFNLGGDILSVARELSKPINNFKMKWSYWPTGDPQHKGDFPDDYNGQTFWISCQVHNLLPDKLKSFWPEWLNIAIGYGVKGYDDPGAYVSRVQDFYLAPDFSLFKLIPGNSPFMVWFKELLDNFRIIPTPALIWNYTDHNFRLGLHL